MGKGAGYCFGAGYCKKKEDLEMGNTISTEKDIIDNNYPIEFSMNKILNDLIMNDNEYNIKIGGNNFPTVEYERSQKRRSLRERIVEFILPPPNTRSTRTTSIKRWIYTNDDGWKFSRINDY